MHTKCSHCRVHPAILDPSHKTPPSPQSPPIPTTLAGPAKCPRVRVFACPLSPVCLIFDNQPEVVASVSVSATPAIRANNARLGTRDSGFCKLHGCMVNGGRWTPNVASQDMRGYAEVTTTIIRSVCRQLAKTNAGSWGQRTYRSQVD